MSWLTALGLCIAGLAAIIVEFFVPAAGIIGLLGFGSMVAGVVIAYSQYGTVIGSLYLIGVVIATPVVMAFYFKLFPRSFVGKWLILGHRPGANDDDQNRDTNASDGSAEDANRTVEPGSSTQRPIGVSRDDHLVGAVGTAVSALRPSGTVVIEGRKYSVVTGGEFLDSGSEVIVTRVEGNRIKVRKGAAES